MLEFLLDNVWFIVIGLMLIGIGTNSWRPKRDRS